MHEINIELERMRQAGLTKERRQVWDREKQEIYAEKRVLEMAKKAIKDIYVRDQVVLVSVAVPINSFPLIPIPIWSWS
jgi:hypothetical protein